MSDKKRAELRERLSELKLIIIDEVSMVSNMMLKHIHERLKELFGTPDSVWFGNISMVVDSYCYILST